MIWNMTVATRWLSIEGALYHPELDEWKSSARTNTSGPRLKLPLVGVDGALFDLDRSEWVVPRSPTIVMPSGSATPDGFVSVDGALFPVDPS